MGVIVTVLFVLALICFFLAAVGIALGRTNAIGLGLFLWLLAERLPGWVA